MRLDDDGVNGHQAARPERHLGLRRNESLGRQVEGRGQLDRGAIELDRRPADGHEAEGRHHARLGRDERRQPARHVLHQTRSKSGLDSPTRSNPRRSYSRIACGLSAKTPR